MIHRSNDIFSGLQGLYFDRYVKLLKHRSQPETIWLSMIINILNKDHFHILNHKSRQVNPYFSIQQLHQSKIKNVGYSSCFLHRGDHIVKNIKEELMKWRHFYLENSQMIDQVKVAKKLMRYIKGRCKIINKRTSDLDIVTSNP